MASERQQVGLSFKKLDLHIHTPKSECFQGSCKPEEIVATAIEKGTRWYCNHRSQQCRMD